MIGAFIMLKKSLKVLVVILIVIIGLIALLFFAQYPIMAINSKLICKDYPVKNIRIKASDYSEIQYFGDVAGWYIGQPDNCLNSFLQKGWTLRGVNTRVKDNRFTEDYFIYGDNTDILACTDGSLYIKNGVSFPEKPYQQAVNSVYMQQNYGDYEDIKLNLTAEESKEFLKILLDESLYTTYEGQYYAYSPIAKHYFFVFDFTELDSINAEGVVYISGYPGNYDEYSFVSDKDDHMYIEQNGKYKPIPAKIAEKLLESF